MRDDFCGPNWDLFANEVACFGLAVIRGWLRSGLSLDRCREKDIRAPALHAHATEGRHTLTSLADDIVTLALPGVAVASAWPVARWPGESTTERTGSGTCNNPTVIRSVSSGRFVTDATAKRNPGGTIH